MACALNSVYEIGPYTATPNPRVGCVLVRAGMVVGTGVHPGAGHPHAEVLALREAGEKARGATAYVSLEPCAHQGRTPPCVDALIQAGVVRVVAAMADPNPLVNGRGFAALTAAGIIVRCGVLEAEARELNLGFIHRMCLGRPWMRLKVAASLDGRTALCNGHSQWITGSHAREEVQAWRARSCAVLTGIGTVRADDPRFSVRLPALLERSAHQPLRIVVDSHYQTPPTARLFETPGVLVVGAQPASAQVAARVATLQQVGAEILVLPGMDGRVDLHALGIALAQRGCNEVLVEAGATLNGTLLASHLIDEILYYMAPIVIGDPASGVFNGPALMDLSHASRWQVVAHSNFNEGDIRLRLRPSGSFSTEANCFQASLQR